MASSRTAVGPALERVLEAVTPANLAVERRHDLAVAVAEALSNAAVHGHRLLAEKPVRVIVAVIADTCAMVVVSDSGPGFDVNGVSDPTAPGRVLVPGGRGVFLMRQLVDHLQYNRTGNRVRLAMIRR